MSLARYAEIRKQAEAAGVDYLVSTVDWITAFLLRDLGRSEGAIKAIRCWGDYQAKASADSEALVVAEQAFIAGWVAVGSGQAAEAKARLSEIEPLLSRIDPGNVVAMTFLFRLLRAEAALAEGDADRAVALGREIVPLDFPSMALPRLARYNQPYVKDVLARAYWKKGDLDAAVAEYRKLTTIDPSNQVRWMISPLYHYRLGRILEEKGDKAGAAVEYRKFLEYWKDADPTHPELADARKRLGK